jgi:hypothetical protein
MKRATLLAIALVAAGVSAVGARADGLPVLGIDVGGSGVAALTGDARYVTIPASPNATIVARVDPAGGRVLASRLVHGVFTIPAVAYDGSASGLAADGKTLVLIQPRVSFPRAVTPLMVIDTEALRPRTIIRLHGDFSFDAVSPRGSLIYLIQYVKPTDPTRYLVRAYDLRVGHLLAKPVTDPLEPGEKMRGNPVTRTTSANGRWAYTLYDGAGATPFVHALDTSSVRARCIDLPMLAGTDPSQLRLRFDRATGALAVANGKTRLAAIDTHTFRARATAPIRALASRTAEGSGARVPWTLLLVSIAFLTAAAGFTLTVSRRRSSRNPLLARSGPQKPGR